MAVILRRRGSVVAVLALVVVLAGALVTSSLRGATAQEGPSFNVDFFHKTVRANGEPGRYDGSRRGGQMSRLLVRLLAAVLTCEGVVLSYVAAMFFSNSLIPFVSFTPERRLEWVHVAKGAAVGLWVVVLWAGARALWTGRYRANQVRRRLLYAVVGGHFVMSFALPVMAGGLSFNRRDGLAALVFWLLGLACLAALHVASPRPEKPSGRGRRHRPKPQTDRRSG